MTAIISTYVSTRQLRMPGMKNKWIYFVLLALHRIFADRNRDNEITR